MVCPRITIITPSFNQAGYLEQTIDSVLSQKYPNLEYMIVDGGSTDGSVEIIKRYERHLAWWTSEKDRGQSHAINKGFARATGSIQAYINSDDYYEPGALECVAALLGGKSRAWLCGGLRYFDGRGTVRTSYYDGDPPADTVSPPLPACTEPDAHFRWFYRYRVNQPSAFWTADLFAAYGPMNETLRYVFDWELFTRIRFHGGIAALPVPKVLAHFRLHDSSKTVSEWDFFEAEIDSVWGGLMRGLPPRERRLASERRRFAQADRLQVEALDLAHNGQRARALRAVAKSVRIYPSLLFRRRTLGCLRRAAAIL